MSISKNRELKVIHNMYDLTEGFIHSITIITTNGEEHESPRVGYKEIARLGEFAATTEYYTELPSLFKLSCSSFIKETRTLNKVTDKRYPHIRGVK